MVHGIETGKKKYIHHNKNTIKWLSKDANEIRTTAESYIQEQQKQAQQPSTSKQPQPGNIIHIMTILIGVFGAISLLTGILLLFEYTLFLGVSLTFIGIVFVSAFLLYELYT